MAWPTAVPVENEPPEPAQAPLSARALPAPTAIAAETTIQMRFLIRMFHSLPAQGCSQKPHDQLQDS